MAFSRLFKAEDSANNTGTTHTAPNGLSNTQLAESMGFKGAHASENICGSTGLEAEPDMTVNFWMKSPCNRENILNPEHKIIGVGYVSNVAADEYISYVSLFMGY